MASNLEEAYKMQDWLFIFEAATMTHLQEVGNVDDCTLLRRQELLEDQIRVCEAIKCVLTDVNFKTYFMENLNAKIFEDIMQIWHNEVTRKNLSKTYAEIKEYVMNNYSSQTAREDRMKVIIDVVSKTWKTNPNAKTDKDEKNKIELSMQGKEKRM